MFKPYRKWHDHSTDISFFCKDEVEQGDVVIAKSYGKGEALDDGNNLAGAPLVADDLGTLKPLGIAMNSVVNYDQSKWWTDRQARQEMIAGSKLPLLVDGEVQLNNIVNNPGDTFGGKTAYFTLDRKLTITPGSKPIGEFLSEPDDDGYVKVYIKRPMA